MRKKPNIHEFMFQKPKSLLLQIEEAFNTTPNLASTLHGQRRITEGQRGKRTALFPSRKCGGLIPVESKLELAHAVVLEGRADVRDYRVQALKIVLPGGFAIPDFIVRMTDEKFEIHEVKPCHHQLSEREAERFDFMERIAQQNGINFRVVDRETLPSESEANRLLRLYSRGHVYPITQHQVSLAVSILNIAALDCAEDVYSILKANDLPTYLFEFLDFHCLFEFPFNQTLIRGEQQ